DCRSGGSRAGVARVRSALLARIIRPALGALARAGQFAFLGRESLSMSQSSSLNTVAIPHTGRAGWLVAGVGGCIGLSIMGDSLLYSILPLAAPALGIPLPAVGVLLSVNRFVRIFSNSSAGIIYERYGARWPFIGATMLGFVATAAYGIGAGLAVLILARLLWGISWSALRQGGYQ